LRQLARLALALLSLVTFSARLQAQAGARDSVVLLTVAAPPDDAAALEAVARELLERLEMQVELRRVERIELQEIRQPPPSTTHYFARVWIGFAKSGRARLYLEQAARDRVLVRDVSNDAHNPELVREELGHILQTAVEGLKAGEEIGAPRREALQAVADEAAASPAPPAPPKTPPTPTKPEPELEPERGRHGARGFRFGPRYELVWLGDGSHFEDGPGAVFGALLPTATQRFGVELNGFFRRPYKVEAAPVGARLQSLAFAALLTFDAWRDEGSLLRLGAGVEADFVRVSAFASAGQSVELAKSHWLRLALGRVVLSYAHDLGNLMDAEITLGAELDPSGTRYVFQGVQGEGRVLSPWPVRPLLSLGVTVP
jgi:hypothetical protein